jgi:hypothetical protein
MGNDKKMVLIKWVDAKFCPGIHSESDVLEHSLSEFESLGYLISKTELTTIIAAERNNDGEYRDITLIPTGSIQSIQSLVSSSAV